MENNAELHWLARAPSVSTMPFCSVGVWQGIRVMDVRASVGIQPFFFFFHFIVLAVGRIKGTTFPIASCIHFSHFLPFGSLHTHTRKLNLIMGFAIVLYRLLNDSRHRLLDDNMITLWNVQTQSTPSIHTNDRIMEPHSPFGLWCARLFI